MVGRPVFARAPGSFRPPASSARAKCLDLDRDPPIKPGPGLVRVAPGSSGCREKKHTHKPLRMDLTQPRHAPWPNNKEA